MNSEQTRFSLSASWIFFLTVILLNSCYEPTEGCLEINAQNFDVEADDPCEECCLLPDLTIAIRNRLSDADSTESFRLKTFYKIGTDSFWVERLHFYLSDLKLITQNDKSITSIDTSKIVFLASPADTQETFIKNDIAYFQRGQIDSKNLGSFHPGNSYKKFRLKFGIPEERQNTIPGSTSASHPLSFSSDSLNYDETDQFILCRLDLVKDTSKIDDVSVIRITASDVKNTVLADVFELDANFDLSTGFNTKLTLRMNFLDWLKDIELQKDSIEDIKKKIIENIPGSFSLEAPEQT